MRVLIADDQRSLGTALAEMVRCCGHEVIAIVGSGLEAIQAYSLHKPDILLMDHRMPKLNGVTACRHIIAKYPAARVVLLSAWSPLDDADESGAVCFLPKPVDLVRLNATLLTIAHSATPSVETPTSPFFNAESKTVDNERAKTKISEPCPSVAIPVEMISPVEAFPADIFPIVPPGPLPVAADVPYATESIEACSPAEQTNSAAVAKAPRKTRSNGPRSRKRNRVA